MLPFMSLFTTIFHPEARMSTVYCGMRITRLFTIQFLWAREFRAPPTCKRWFWRFGFKFISFKSSDYVSCNPSKVVECFFFVCSFSPCFSQRSDPFARCLHTRLFGQKYWILIEKCNLELVFVLRNVSHCATRSMSTSWTIFDVFNVPIVFC